VIHWPAGTKWPLGWARVLSIVPPIHSIVPLVPPSAPNCRGGAGFAEADRNVKRIVRVNLELQDLIRADGGVRNIGGIEGR